MSTQPSDSLHLILPFLRPIEAALLDPTVSEILINSNWTMYVERDGVLESIGIWPESPKHLTMALQQIARHCGSEIDDQHPQLDARLPDGSRVAAMLPPVAVGAIPQVSIRKFQRHYFSLDALVAAGSITSEVAELLRHAIQGRETIVISGGTGSGKTTLANALANLIPPEERIGVIESTAEIQLNAPNVFRFEARRDQPGLPEISQRELLQFSLRHRPDRLFVGEVRGAEAFDLLQALNTGHAGSLTTVHANGSEDALNRLAELALMASTDMPYLAIQTRIARLIDIVIHVARDGGKRRVTEVLEVHGFDTEHGLYRTKMLYQFQETKEAHAITR